MELIDRMISNIFEEVESCISMNTILTNFKMSALPTLYVKIVELVKYLRNGNACERDTVILLFQDMLEVVTHDLMANKIRDLAEVGCLDEVKNHIAASLVLPEVTPPWEKQIQRLYLLLTVKNSTLANLEARRRIAFFSNSLFMDMPCAPEVRKMLSFSVLTPYYSEETIYSSYDIVMNNEDGVSIMYYLQKIFPDEWNNFMERIKCKKEAEILENEQNVIQLRHWVSLRGQTLFRTVRGMMYYGRALRLEAFLEMANELDILEGYKAVTSQIKEDKRSQRPLHEQLAAVADLKFTYVVTCQKYGYQKQNGDRRATDILQMMVNSPSLRVAYVDEVEDRDDIGKDQKSYYSVLVKASENLEQEIYRIKLPGPPKVGEGKPENQNNAIIFTRGEALQAIDMNQDNHLEDALKMRNLLEEFNEDHGVRPPTILGVREHVFTGSFSTLAWFMSNQEISFFTSQQRVLARPLKVRFHYGHPDVFDRIFHITRGGISKASRGINLSEDIFAGFNSTLRCGNVTHHEYIQVGKGRDIGLNQISMFEAKVSCGNGEQTLSRDLYRLGNHFDFFRMLSCYFTTIGYYISAMMATLTSYAFLYGRLYLSLSGLDQSIVTPAKVKGDIAFNTAMTTVSIFQMGLLMVFPMFMKIQLEKGFKTSLMQMPLAAIFSTFSFGTKVHYYGRTILHGGTKYRGTGRGFVFHHVKFAENYQMYSRTHFTKGLELLILLTTYHFYGSTVSSSAAYVTTPLWFLAISWLFAPFIFNPFGFKWQKIVDDWYDWMEWMSRHGGSGVPASKSWESWWDEEQEHFLYTGLLGRLWEIVLSLRFFLIQYWLVYHSQVANGDSRSMVYGLSWLIVVGVVIIFKIEFIDSKMLSPHLHLEYKLLRLLLLIGFVVTVSLIFFFLNLKVGDIYVCLLTFIPTGWALLSIAIACKPLMKNMNMWNSIKSLGRGYEFIMGIIIFSPVAVLAWFPFISEFQTRLLFNQDFSRGLHS